jgi:hypothetical protein
MTRFQGLLFRIHEALGCHHFVLRRRREGVGYVARCSCGAMLKKAQ